MMFNNTSSEIPYYSRYSRYGYRYPYYTYKSYNNPYATNSYASNVQSMHNTSIGSNARINANRVNTANKSNTVNKNINHKMSNDSSNYNINKSNNYYNQNESCSDETKDSPLFQLFGISLYFDDILLVCLIFFLYQEGVKDEGLFIALILLLLS